jgi:hypothetical protein
VKIANIKGFSIVAIAKANRTTPVMPLCILICCKDQLLTLSAIRKTDHTVRSNIYQNRWSHKSLTGS